MDNRAVAELLEQFRSYREERSSDESGGSVFDPALGIVAREMSEVLDGIARNAPFVGSKRHSLEFTQLHPLTVAGHLATLDVLASHQSGVSIEGAGAYPQLAVKKMELVEAVIGMFAEAGLGTRSGVGFDWMSNRVPIEDGWSTPPRILYRLSALHMRLGGDWKARQNKRESQLRFDILVGNSTAIEIDTLEHFSRARMTSLGFYDEIEHALDLDTYRELCQEHHEQADRTYRSPETSEFAFPGGRLAQIAYFDFAKDVLSAAHGLRLIRIPAPEGELTPSVSLQLRLLLQRSWAL